MSDMAAFLRNLVIAFRRIDSLIANSQTQEEAQAIIQAAVEHLIPALPTRTNRFGIPPQSLRYLTACDGTIGVYRMAEILPKSHNPNQDHSNLLFAAISGLIPYNDNKDKQMESRASNRHPHCIANQLEKIGILVNRGWRLDARESGYVAWSKMLL
eukprot:6419_1